MNEIALLEEEMLDGCLQKSDESSVASDSQSSDDDHDSDDDESDCSSSCGSVGGDDALLAMLQNANVTSTTNPPSASPGLKLRRSSSFTFMHMGETELTPMQVNVMLTQSRDCNPSKVTRRGSMPVSQTMHNLKHIQGHPMEEEHVSHSSNQSRVPLEVYFEILQDNGYNPKILPFGDVDNYFQDITESRLSSYTSVIINAVKIGDVDLLRGLHFEEKRNLDGCNRFGESIVHTACRFGQAEVVRFLIEEASVDICLIDDFGRNPCHDAAWQAEPNMELIQLLIKECPDLLLISDKRGFSPLQYLRKSQWSVWVDLMTDHRNDILPKKLLQRQRPRSLVAEGA